MGSSAMGASVLRNKIQAAGFTDVTVVNKAIANLTDTYDVVVTHQDLTDRAKQRDRLGGARLRGQLHEQPAVRRDRRAGRSDTQRRRGDGAAAAPRCSRPPTEKPTCPLLAGASRSSSAATRTTRDAAIAEAGAALLVRGAVEPAYVDAMHEREESVSTHMGNFLAIPHGTNDAKEHDHDAPRSRSSATRTAIDWNGKEVKFVVGIAGAGNEHLALLGEIAKVFVDKEQVAQLEAAQSPDEVARILGGSATGHQRLRPPRREAPHPWTGCGVSSCRGHSTCSPYISPSGSAISSIRAPSGSGKYIDTSLCTT